MKHSDFRLGQEFTSAGGERRWRVTDIGSRTVIAIRIDQVTVVRSSGGTETRRNMDGVEAAAGGWFNGPPYGVAETVFDEYDLEGCEPVAEGAPGP